MYVICAFIWALYAIKCLVLGTEFNLIHWWKHREAYTKHYFSRKF